MFETEHVLAKLHAEPTCRETLADMLAHPLTATGDRLVERLGPFARVRTLSSACSSGANALVVAAAWLLAGEVDAVVAGASDGLCRLTFAGFNALAAIDPEPCKPFDRRRRGTVLGEGAGFLVLERAERAKARGAAAVAELAGWAAGSEAHHITNPAPDGAVVASLIRRALARAGIAPAQVDYVNAHGTGTPVNDSTEAAAIIQALGAESSRVPVSSSKAQIGHTLGAAGAIEAAITSLVVQRRTLVPTAGLDEPDPALPLVHVPHVGREVPRVRAAVSSAFGFGGMDTVLVFADPSFERDALDVPAERVVVTGAAIFGACGLAAAEACAEIPAQRHEVGSIVDTESFIDPVKGRRLDRAARIASVAVREALAQGGAPAAATGLILGSAFGNVDACAAFMHRIFDKGPRAASPAEFPSLVPSSAVGHVSIYLGLRGPAFLTADLAASGESAFVEAAQLVAAGEARSLVAGAVEPKSDIVERVLGALFAHAPSQTSAPRGDLAAAVLVESEDEAKQRGARVLARVAQTLEWRHDRAPLASLISPPADGAEVVLARANGGSGVLLDGTAWRACPRHLCAPALGESDGLGAAAVAVAAGRIATGRASHVLVLGLARARGYAIVLTQP
jgi:3-oxoacyl-[acyl-carrier-protein] synthase II